MRTKIPVLLRNMDGELVLLTSDSELEDFHDNCPATNSNKPLTKNLSDDDLLNFDLDSPLHCEDQQNDNFDILEIEQGEGSYPHAGTSTAESPFKPGSKKAHKEKQISVEHLTKKTSTESEIDSLTCIAKKRAKTKDDKARDKAYKAAEQANKRVNKSADCLKYLTTVIDSRLFDTIALSGNVLTQLQSMEMKHSIIKSPIRNSIHWVREKIHFWVNEDGEVTSTSKKYEEDDSVLVLLAQEFAVLPLNSISDYIEKTQKLLNKKNLTVIVYGLATFLKEQSKKDKRRFREHVAASSRANNHANRSGEAASEDNFVSASEIELLKAKFLLETQCSLWPVETSEELGKILTRLTKAVAERPYKEERLEQTFDFYAAEVSGNIKVNKDGHGLERLWQQQLMQFPLVALETSQAIASRFQSPQSLIKAYKLCKDETEASLLLQDIPIRRHAGPLSTSRKIGPELSKKIYKLLMSKEGSEVL